MEYFFSGLDYFFLKSRSWSFNGKKTSVLRSPASWLNPEFQKVFWFRFRSTRPQTSSRASWRQRCRPLTRMNFVKIFSVFNFFVIVKTVKTVKRVKFVFMFWILDIFSKIIGNCCEVLNPFRILLHFNLQILPKIFWGGHVLPLNFSLIVQ